MPGLSGGQRKLLLFELIFQRTSSQHNLLIVLDEPFAGVTDEFVPFIVDRLNSMREKHNILVVTNDHVETLKRMADNIVTVSAIDRTKVKINYCEGVDRNLALQSMSIGDDYVHNSNGDDLKFFARVELSRSGGIPGVTAFTIVAYCLFLATFWNSKQGSEALILIASGMISFFSINPYLIQLVDWRIHMMEEAEALMHASKSMNKLLKTCLTCVLIIAICLIQFGVMNAVVKTSAFSGFGYFIAILFDNVSWMMAPICLGIYTDLSIQTVQLLGSIPFLLMIFFSTTFSSGVGLDGVKSLRYLFSRFYLFCETDGIKERMEGCPDSNNLLYLVLSTLFLVFAFVLIKMGVALKRKLAKEEQNAYSRQTVESIAFAELQLEMFNEKASKNTKTSSEVTSFTILHFDESYKTSPLDESVVD
ncbi:hypothetical protein ACHAXS_014099 [Conticribra weissflogii]